MYQAHSKGEGVVTLSQTWLDVYVHTVPSDGPKGVLLYHKGKESKLVKTLWTACAVSPQLLQKFSAFKRYEPEKLRGRLLQFSGGIALNAQYIVIFHTKHIQYLLLAISIHIHTYSKKEIFNPKRICPI